MGKIYSQKVLNVEKPQVYLLSNGIEEEKGPQEVKEAHRILKESSFEGFAGNVESRDALDGHCDVIVTGGYAGNVFLKSSEGMAKMMSSMIKEAFYTNIFSKIGYLLSKKGFKKMKKTMNYEIYGGAMLVGVNGVVVKAHGSSNGFSFYRALCVAYDMAKKDVVNLIKEGVNHD
jgi:glycerol-3-phosphate acyltransferase PlsX